MSKRYIVQTDRGSGFANRKQFDNLDDATRQAEQYAAAENLKNSQVRIRDRETDQLLQPLTRRQQEETYAVEFMFGRVWQHGGHYAQLPDAKERMSELAQTHQFVHIRNANGEIVDKVY